MEKLEKTSNIYITGLRKTLKFSLELLVSILSASAKEKEHVPTQEEILCGERILLSDKYYFPDQKFPED